MRVFIITGILFAACCAFSQTNDGTRVWTARDGKQITASLSHYANGLVILSDGRKKYEIRESALSESDRDYLKTFDFDPYYGLSEKRVKEKLAEDKASADIDAQIKANAAAAEAEKNAKIDAVISKLMSHISDNPAQGMVGTIQTGKVHLDQIVAEDSALVTYKWGLTGQVAKRQVMLVGVRTSGFADDMDIALPGKYIIDGTVSFDTAMGAKRTVLVMRPVPKENNSASVP